MKPGRRIAESQLIPEAYRKTAHRYKAVAKHIDASLETGEDLDLTDVFTVQSEQ